MLRKTLCVVSVVLLWNSLTLAQASNARARKFDEFGDIEASDLIARLDNFAVMLSSEPSSKGFLIVIGPGATYLDSVTGMLTE